MRGKMKVSRACFVMLLGAGVAISLIAASTLPARASIPSIASSSVTWTVNSAGWTGGVTNISDDGGNYSYATFSPLGIYCGVSPGNSVTSRHGTITYVQTFVWTGDPKVIADLNYTTQVDASAVFLSSEGSAHAKSKSVYLVIGGVTIVNEAEATALFQMSSVSDSHKSSDNIHVGNTQITTFSETATTEADVSA